MWLFFEPNHISMLDMNVATVQAPHAGDESQEVWTAAAGASSSVQASIIISTMTRSLRLA